MGSVGIDLEGDVQQYLNQLVLNLYWENSWYCLTLNEAKIQLGCLCKTIGSMNVDELLKSVWTSETNQAIGMEANNGPSSTSLQCQGSLNLSGTFDEKMVDEVWRDIQQGEKMRSSDVVKREPTTGEMTLEDFLAKAGAMDESSLSHLMPMDIPGTPQCFSQRMGLSPAPSIDALSDTPILGRKRDASDIMDRGIEKKLRRKIKNRESAARSRARKQAYHNELVGKVSRLEEQNMRLKKEKEVENCFCGELSNGPRYQLRRTSSAIF